MRAPLRVGLVGCGRWGRLILRDLKALAGEVTVVAKSADSLANARAGGADRIVPEIGDLPAVAGVVVAVNTRHHAKVVEALLPLGVPVFCEKPLTCDVAAAERIVAAAGERVFVMDKWRYHGGVLELARIAKTGELGPVLGLKTIRRGWGNPHADVSCAWILMPHDLSIAQEILGGLGEPTRARAEVAEERLLGLTVWLDGPVWQQVEVSARSPVHERRVELLCRDGVAVLADAYDDAVLTTLNPPAAGGPAPGWTRRPITTRLPLEAELTAFVAHLSGGPPPRSSAMEALAVVRTIARAHVLAGIEPRIL
jgi:predicted dehydrogenase